MSNSEPDNRPPPGSWEERVLNEEQLLLDLGWRVDYERMGISRPGAFHPLVDLRTAAEALHTSALQKGKDPHQPRPPYDPNEWFLSLKDLEDAICALESKIEHGFLAGLEKELKQRGLDFDWPNLWLFSARFWPLAENNPDVPFWADQFIKAIQAVPGGDEKQIRETFHQLYVRLGGDEFD
jgi:hypothetical protein